MRVRDVRGTAIESAYDLATFIVGTFGFVLVMRLLGDTSKELSWSFAVFQGVCLVYLGQYFRRKHAESAANAAAVAAPDGASPTPR